MNEIDILNQYYEQGLEDSRLSKDKTHRIEFLTTVRYIDKYIQKDHRILEIGAGTGVYSLYYAEKGYQVDAVELIQYNIDVFKSKIKDNMNVNVRQGNALDLSCYSDNTYDVTLVFGPLYHLYNEHDKQQAISEAIRVTKPNGIIYIAYLTHDAIMINYCLRKNHMLEIDKLCDDNYKFKDDPNEIFVAFHISDFNNMMQNYNVDLLNSVATDGLAPAVREYVNELNEEEFQQWLKYHFAICERFDLQGYSSHMLYICKKKLNSQINYK